MRFFSHQQSATKELKKDLLKQQRTRIPELPELDEEGVSYELGSLIHITITPELYLVEEPSFTEQEQKTFDTIKRGLYEIINIDRSENGEEYLEKTVRIIISELSLHISEMCMRKILYYCYRDFIGYGKIEALMRDPLVSEIQYAPKNKTVEITHKRYGKLATDIILKPEDLRWIANKLAVNCNFKLDSKATPIDSKTDALHVQLAYEAQTIATLLIQKTRGNYPSPIELTKMRRVSPEILAFLWMLIEDKQTVFVVKDTDLLSAMAFFLPPHSIVLTNIENYYPNYQTITILGESTEEEDYALLIDSLKTSGALMASLDAAAEAGNIVFYMENGTIKSVKEDGKELFNYSEGKFLYSLEESIYMRSKGNKAILMEEFKLRTKLLHVLEKANLSDTEYKKVIGVYYENPVAVLKKAGLV